MFSTLIKEKKTKSKRSNSNASVLLVIALNSLLYTIDKHILIFLMKKLKIYNLINRKWWKSQMEYKLNMVEEVDWREETNEGVKVASFDKYAYQTECVS